MTNRERVRAAVKAELPDCTVRFEEEGDTYTRFAVFAPGGDVLSGASPHTPDVQLDGMSDDQIREHIRFLCGLKPGGSEA